MRFECEFQHPKTGERRTIAAQLTADEVTHAGGTDLYLFAYALRHAHREAPAGFLHIANGVRRIAMN